VSAQRFSSAQSSSSGCVQWPSPVRASPAQRAVQQARSPQLGPIQSGPQPSERSSRPVRPNLPHQPNFRRFF
ncbi:hypothetical protein CRG98_048207, partial [Punica granatum]